MKIKTFYAKSMSDALREVRNVMGPEAILLSSRELSHRAGAWGRSGGVEVVAAVDAVDDLNTETVDVVSSSLRQISEEQLLALRARGEEKASFSEEMSFLSGEAATYTPATLLRQPAAKTGAAHVSTNFFEDDGFEDDAADASDFAATYTPATLSRRSAAKTGAASGSTALPITSICEVASKSGSPRGRGCLPASPFPADTEDGNADVSGLDIKEHVSYGLYSDLVAGDVEPALARYLISEAVAGLSPKKRRNRAALINAVAQKLPGIAPEASGENDLPGKKVVAFIGPTGVGKTTSIAKLAAHLTLGRKKKVVLFSLDGYRIGAVEQLRTYAGLIGVPFRFVSQVSELTRLIAENDRRDYILIDTAGRGRKDMHVMDQLAGFLGNSDYIERHLVMSASMKSSDMRRIQDQFVACRPDHLLFTKLDETSTPGPILNELARTKKSFSYYTDGQRVPDDLHIAARGQIMNLILDGTRA